MARPKINIDAAIMSVVKGTPPDVAAREAGVSVATVWRRLRTLENRPAKVKPGPKGKAAQLETFRKDVRDLLEEEEVVTDTAMEDLVQMITELAAAALCRRLPYTIGKSEGS
jgi:hypothetical protein